MRRAVRLEGRRLTVGGTAVALEPGGRLLLVAVGKCATAAAAALREVLGGRLDGGIALDVDGAAAADLGPVVSLRGTHPLPSACNVAASRAIVELVGAATARDLVLCVVSGGGSTLLCLPPEGASPDAESAAVAALLRAGASIREINTIRKHTSLARGGQLAARAFPARVVSLVFSDVPGAPLDWVASGPTLPDATTVDDAARVLAHYGIGPDAAPGLVLVETPKARALFDGALVHLAVSNEVALGAMAGRAGALGYAATVVTATLDGEAREAGERVVRELRASPAGTARLYGGETTVTVRGRGTGGRNQEVALSALRRVGAGEIVLALASDGRDNGDAAGALADVPAREKAALHGLDPDACLADNDSGAFFERTGDRLLTGATGANVADLVVALKR